MNSRRQFLFVAAAAAGLTPLLTWLGSPAVANGGAGGDVARFPIEKSDAEWRAALTSQQYRVLRTAATERPGSSPLEHESRQGTFACAGCGQPLFSSSTKFDSGTGWPSFFAPIDGAVGTAVDRSWFMVRTEVHCSRCGGHLGHLFDDGPRPTGLRYCMNGAAMTFVPERA
jgi:peptide-methionine (R)-S-oxide reductase